MNASSNSCENITVVKENIFLTCEKFFNNHPHHIQKMVNIVEAKSNISLRIIDWFIEYYLEDNNLSYINTAYKSTLSLYGKQYFDPFKRAHRIDYKYMENDSDKVLETSIGQLNFFKWAFENNVIDLIEKNLLKIRNHMNQLATARFQDPA